MKNSERLKESIVSAYHCVDSDECINLVCESCKSILRQDLNEFEEAIKAEVIDEFVKAFLDKENQSNYIQLNQHTQSWNGYAKNISEQLKGKNNDRYSTKRMLFGL